MLSATKIAVDFRWAGRSRVTALDGVSVSLGRGESVGVVGESGSGKSTLLRVLLGLVRPRSGEVTVDGVPLRRSVPAAVRRSVQIVQQDPYTSLNGRHRISTILGQPLTVHRGLRGSAARVASADLLAQVGLDPDMLDRTPAQFSGGQRQRIAIARALSVRPNYLLLDEPLSALDSETAGGILGLLRRLRATGVGMLLVSHDLEPVRQLCDRVLVLRSGSVIAQGPTDSVLDSADHYVREFVAAAASSRRDGDQRTAVKSTLAAPF